GGSAASPPCGESGGAREQAANVGSFDRDPACCERNWQRLSRSDRIAIVAAREALTDAGLLDSGLSPDRVGVMFGVGTGDLVRNEEWFTETATRGMRRAAPRKILGHFPTAPADVVASLFGLEGIKAGVLSACSSSTVAIGYAGGAIASGQADAILAGASDVLCRLTLTGFNALRLVDPEPCRPFCRSRKGMNI